MAITKTPIDQGIMARALTGVGAALRGVADWFGPGDPLPPLVGEAQQDSVRGRQFDFPVAFNRQTQPRANENISFGALRALADNLDVLRLVIETRKDQMAKMKWTVKPENPDIERDKRCDEVEAFFKFPDREHDWDTWLRVLLEELFVIDAPALYVRRTNGGDLYALEPLDGATIKRVLDAHGRTPMPPESAYQQVLKGIPAVGYTREELIYRPRNVRVWKVYGYSPVEQITMTINTAIRRALHVLQSYTEGNVPEALIGVPETWTVDQIRQFQQYWDSILVGETGERRRAKFVPGAMKYQPTKDAILKDEFDEWIARVVCFAFSVAPTPFVKQQNRATAETAHQAALEEGLAPVMMWVKNLMNHVVKVVMGQTDLSFDWDEEEAQDPLVAAQINKMYLDAGVITPDEVRTTLGMEPLTDEQREEIKAATAPPPMLGFGGAAPHDDDDPNGGGTPPPPGGKKPDPDAPPKDDAEKGEVTKAAKKRRPGPISPDRATVVKLEQKLAGQVGAFLKAQSEKIVAAVTKSDDGDVADPPSKKKALAAVISIDWDELVHTVTPTLADIATDGAAAALEQVGLGDDTEIYGAQVTKWAQDRAAEMVGKKWVDGELVDNPNAEWVITDSTRDMIQGMVAGSIDEGATTDELAAQLSDSFAFSEDRAEMIARTETRMADMGGQMEAYAASGVVAGTEWSTSNDDLVSEVCQANADAGVVPLGDPYPSGDTAPPGHPNCFVSGTRVAAAGVARHYERWFSGMVKVIRGAGIDEITVTPNHPILTRRGWVTAGDLQIGDDLVQCADLREALISSPEPYDNYIESSIEQVSRALWMTGGVSAEVMPTTAVDFHGDGVVNGKVNVIRSDRALSNNDPKALQVVVDGQLADGNLSNYDAVLHADCAPTVLVESDYGAAPRIVGGARQGGTVIATRFAHPKGHAFATGPDGQPEPFEAVANGDAVAPDAPSYIHARLAGHVTFVKVEQLLTREFRGHVYNLETKDGWYVANGIVAHNCRCCVVAALIEDPAESE